VKQDERKRNKKNIFEQNDNSKSFPQIFFCVPSCDEGRKSSNLISLTNEGI